MMNIRTKLERASEYGIRPEAASRLDVEEFKEVGNLCAEAQWQILKQPEWKNILEVFGTWTVNTIFEKIGFQLVKYVGLSELKKLSDCSMEKRCIAIVYGLPVDEVEKLPSWLTLAKVGEDRRLIANDWVWRSQLSQQQLLGLSDVEIDFLVSVKGFVSVNTDWQNALEIVSSFKQEEWEEAFWLLKALGKVPVSLTPWGAGLEGFCKGLLCKLLGTPFLEKLRWKKPEENALINQNDFWQRTDFDSFSDVPEIMLKTWNGKLPQNCQFRQSNLQFLKEPNNEFCVHYEGIEEGHTALAAFKLLTRPLNEWIEEYGDEPWKFLDYHYSWNARELKYYDYVVKSDVHSSLSKCIATFVYKLYFFDIGEDDDFLSEECYERFISLLDTKLLDAICKQIRKSEWHYRDKLKFAFRQYLRGDVLGFPGSHYGTVDFIRAFNQAQRWQKWYDCDFSLVWLSFLEGNHWEENGRLFYETLGFQDGVWKKYVFEEGTIPDCKCVWGLAEYLQVIKIGDKTKIFDKICIM